MMPSQFSPNLKLISSVIMDKHACVLSDWNKLCPIKILYFPINNNYHLQATKMVTFNKSELGAQPAQAYIPGPGISSSPGAPPDHRLVDETNTELDM